TADVQEIESADDFLLTNETFLRQATFTGLVPAGTDVIHVTKVNVEIYRGFPNDSDTNRTPNVPTRKKPPSHVAFASRYSPATNAKEKLNFDPEVLADNFSAANSVLDGISVGAGGDGEVSGEEVRFGVTFPNAFDLPADHYFFVPQVELDNGQFYWLSAPKPIVAPGTPFFPDLQSWIRNEALQPDWLRVGTDIVDGAPPVPTFNASFSLHGNVSHK